MVEKIGLFTGSFDPVTLGHVDLIERASRLVDKLYVGIFYNQEKSAFLSLERRYALLSGAVASIENVEVITSSQALTVDVAKNLGVTVLVRGLRGAEDVNYEASLDFFNRALAPNLETIYLLAQPHLKYISSSRVRELLSFHADIRPYVPQNVVKELMNIEEI